jgi:hypothetical protein
MEPKTSALETQNALNIITSAQLTPTEHLLLGGFVKEAVDPGGAARYILRRVDENPDCSVEELLRNVKQDWRRLVTKCELTFSCFSVSSFLVYA